jgi:hypothetical protein
MTEQDKPFEFDRDGKRYQLHAVVPVPVDGEVLRGTVWVGEAATEADVVAALKASHPARRIRVLGDALPVSDFAAYYDGLTQEQKIDLWYECHAMTRAEVEALIDKGKQWPHLDTRLRNLVHVIRQHEARRNHPNPGGHGADWHDVLAACNSAELILTGEAPAITFAGQPTGPLCARCGKPEGDGIHHTTGMLIQSSAHRFEAQGAGVCDPSTAEALLTRMRKKAGGPGLSTDDGLNLADCLEVTARERDMYQREYTKQLHKARIYGETACRYREEAIKLGAILPEVRLEATNHGLLVEAETRIGELTRERDELDVEHRNARAVAADTLADNARMEAELEELKRRVRAIAVRIHVEGNERNGPAELCSLAAELRGAIGDPAADPPVEVPGNATSSDDVVTHDEARRFVKECTTQLPSWRRDLLQYIDQRESAEKAFSEKLVAQIDTSGTLRGVLAEALDSWDEADWVGKANALLGRKPSLSQALAEVRADLERERVSHGATLTQRDEAQAEAARLRELVQGKDELAELRATQQAYERITDDFCEWARAKAEPAFAKFQHLLRTARVEPTPPPADRCEKCGSRDAMCAQIGCLSDRERAEPLAAKPLPEYVTRTELTSLLRAAGAAIAANHCEQGTFGPAGEPGRKT